MTRSFMHSFTFYYAAKTKLFMPNDAILQKKNLFGNIFVFVYLNIPTKHILLVFLRQLVILKSGSIVNKIQFSFSKIIQLERYTHVTNC